MSFTGVNGIMIHETAETFGLITQDDKFRGNSATILKAVLFLMLLIILLFVDYLLFCCTCTYMHIFIYMVYGSISFCKEMQTMKLYSLENKLPWTKYVCFSFVACSLYI